MYYSMIGLLAVLTLLIVNQDILHNPRVSFDKPAWNVYRRFLFAVMAYYVMDILWGFLESRKLAGMLFANTTVYYVAMAVGVLFWAEFTVTYLEEKRRSGRVLVFVGRLISGLIALLSIINIFTPVLFTVTPECVYNPLPVRYVMLGCQIILLLSISGYAFISMLRLAGGDRKRRRYRILASFGFIMAALLFAQLWFPELPLYTIAYMLGTSMLHTFVADDDKEEYKRGQEEAEKIAEFTKTITSLLNNMPGMAFTKDSKTGVYMACNQAFAEYAHKENPEGVIGLTDAEIFDPETAAHFVKDDKVAASMSTPYIFFEDVPDAVGNQRQLQTTKLKYRDSSGRLCILGMCQDITDVIRIRHENAMSKEAYEKAVSSGLMYNHIAQTLARDYTDMYYVNCDTEEYIKYQRSNDGSRLLEMRRGWHFFSDCRAELAEQVYPDDREDFRQAMSRKTLMKTLSRKKTFFMTLRMTAEAGPVYVSMKVSRMENDERFIIIGITNVDAEMRDAMAKSEALSAALSAAEQAGKDKTSFLANVSHEIRTPINAIIGLDTLALKRTGMDSQTRGYLEKIGESSRHLLGLVNDILELSRIESGHVALRKEAFSFSAMLDQINAEFRARCADKGLTYECRLLDEFDDSYVGDDTMLKEVLTNILSNAVKYTEAGSVIMEVGREAADDDSSTLCFLIKDTGIGMDKDFIPGIFDPFSQADSGRTGKFDSTGMGMAITKGIVELMNGSISVESEKGEGTAVEVKVVMRYCDEGDEVSDSVIDPQAMHVLVVDDDPVEAEHARSVLEEVGIQADTAAGAEEALRKMEAEHARHTPYNLVLMDWNMPGMNGLEASAEIHRQFEEESIVVVLTAYNWYDIQDEAHRAGVNSFLTKPLLPEKVIEELDRIARRSNLSVFKEKKMAELSGRRVLLAEDMEINAEIMLDIFDMEGIKADRAKNGRMAVELFEESPAGTYSAILMDVRMPEMDGLEAAAKIRALDREDAKRVPIIALTASAFDEDLQHSLEAGMNGHLSKPVDPDNLVATLGELIYEAEARTEDGAA
jgi:signal transduction histidine kinase/DNA-binding response OmpR family regulator